jgi:hypothetical protein
MILKQGRQIVRLQAGAASGIFIPNRIAVNPQSIFDGCVEVEMQLQAKKKKKNSHKRLRHRIYQHQDL